MGMIDFLASLDRKRLLINLVGYLIILVLYLTGPDMSGLMGGAVRAYLWLFPAYFLVINYLTYRRKRKSPDD